MKFNYTTVNPATTDAKKLDRTVAIAVARQLLKGCTYRKELPTQIIDPREAGDVLKNQVCPNGSLSLQILP